MLEVFLLGYPDSNQERQDQNLQCYHYTISQCFLFSSAKVVTFLQTSKFFGIFFADSAFLCHNGTFGTPFVASDAVAHPLQ